MAVRFFNEDSTVQIKNKIARKTWIKKIIEEYNFKVGELNFIFCTDEYLKQVNIDYLNHDYYTDIITFDNSEDDDIIEGDIFVSTDRVAENALNLQISFDSELNRVLIHGVLHLIGFDDHSDEDILIIREKENLALSQTNTF